jgi:ATP-dependent DNA helicase RecQ
MHSSPTTVPRLADSHRVLKEIFGFEFFRPGQETAVEALLAGRNVLSVMPTGSGKSLCFQVPALMLGGLTLVVSPLVALMQDQVAALRLSGVAADSINSSQDRAENVAAWRRAVAGETRILYLAPERLMTERMLSALRSLPVRLIAIDEAHCISQWGPAFRPEYESLARLREVFPQVPVAALTATADEATRRDILAKLFGGEAESIVLGFDRPNIRLAVEEKQDWKRQLLGFLDRHKGESGIVYCLSRKKCEQTAEFLTQNGTKALSYHAGMDKAARAANQATFMSEPGVVVVATIAFGMGIDKPDVRFVFHADLPSSIEAYYQEIGRAGRDGAPAKAHMLYGLDDIRMRRLFIEQEDAGEERKRREHKRLDAFIGYCESPQCRRQVLLTYFGEEAETCGNCDICLDPPEMADGTAEGQQVLTTVYRTGQRFGAGHIVDILRGSKSEKVTRAGHERLPTFGLGAKRNKSDWHTLIRQLVAAGYLQIDIQGFGGLAITDKGRGLLNGEAGFRFRKSAAQRTRASLRRDRSAADAEEMSPDEAALLGTLKALRLDLAKERGVPAYVIFSDRTLVDMARRQPRSRSDFAEVHGVGEAKLKNFAAPFLAAIAGGTSDFADGG